MRKIILVAFFVLCGFTISAVQVDAAILEKTINRTFNVKENRVSVNETVTAQVVDSRYLIPSGSEEVFTIFNPIISDPDAQEKIDSALPSIKVVDGNGKKINFRTEIEDQHIVIYAKRPTNLVFGQTYVMTATYDNYALTSRNGGLFDIYIPSFAEDFNFEDETTKRDYKLTSVNIPKTFGENNFVIPNKQINEQGSNWNIKFTQADLTGTISWIQMGTKQFYEFNITQPYPATTSIPLFYNTYDITLPRDITAGPVTQEVFYTDISPEPDEIITDKDGNLIASFRIPATKSGEINVSGYTATAQDKQIQLENSGSISDIDLAIANEHTQPAPYWEAAHPDILSTANQLKGDMTNVYDIISATYSYVVDKIDYSNVKRFGLNTRQGALATFQGGAAVCMEYSDLFIALSRAQGIPARAAFGYGYDSRSTDGIQVAHQWAEVYIPSLGEWVGVDTTWGESGPAIIGGDLNHFYKYVASVDPETPAPVSLAYFGITPEVSDEKFTITAIKELPTNLQARTQEELLELYPEKSDIDKTIRDVYESATLATSSIDAGLDDFYQESFGVSSATSNILKLLTYIVPTLVIFGLIVYLGNKGKNSES